MLHAPLQTSAEEAYRKFDALASRHMERLRRLTKTIGDAKTARNQDQLTQAIAQYDGCLEAYIPASAAGVGAGQDGRAGCSPQQRLPS